MSEWLADYGWMLLTPALGLAGLWFLPQLARQPERGLYLAFFSSGILLSPELPIVREKLTVVEVIMLLTWMAMLSRAGGRRPGWAP